MDNFKEVNRRDFLKCIPKYLAYRVRSLTKECLSPSDVKTEPEDVHALDNNGLKVARLDTEYCLAWEGGDCQFCYLACPLRDRAITIEDQKPSIHVSVCDGCARCVTACLTVNDSPAIKMVLAG